MSRGINIRVIKKQTARERLRAIFATRYSQLLAASEPATVPMDNEIENRIKT